MNLEESQNFKDKLNSVITAAQRYESYTKQLANTRTELKEYIDIAKESNGKLIDVSKQAEELLKKAISLQDSLREDVAVVLSPELDKFNTTLAVTRDAQAVSLKNFEKDLNDFALKIGDAVEGIEKLFKDEVS